MKIHVNIELLQSNILNINKIHILLIYYNIWWNVFINK